MGSCCASSTEPHAGYRLLTLEGEVGAVYCRVHDPGARRTLPRYTEHGTFEFATRTLLRMANLVVCRQIERGASMIGPGDYFCNLDDPANHSFTIRLPTSALPPHARFPTFEAHPIDDEIIRDPCTLRCLRAADVARITATWISGQAHPAHVARHVADYEANYGITTPFGNSLFPKPGLLEVHTGCGGAASLCLPAFDATEVDLYSAFGCRLVRNDQPFRVVETPSEDVHPKDWHRPVTYDFQEGYARAAVRGADAGGLFLETHDFVQTMTPANPDACGFIVLGRWADATAPLPHEPTGRALELAAVRIPYGWTLVVGRGAIHGDTTFRGTYIMAMTSNHETMGSADVAFVKHAASGANVDIQCPEHYVVSKTLPPCGAGEGVPVSIPPPVVVYRDASRQELEAFAETTKGANFMLQPFSKLSWTTTLFRRVGWYPGIPKK